ncbi:hypothetical protein [Prauserella rugosa]|uniref:hypothetical protein n=1 Tax=Prauserella rugosa TaxID=43354 RepID=UPI003CCC7A78
MLIDPTHDFGKNTWHSLELLRSTDRLVLPVACSHGAIQQRLHRRVARYRRGQPHRGHLAAIAIAAMAGAAVSACMT